MAKRPHLWGPSTLNHGTQQCRLCLCTWEEAQFALGQECPKATAEQPPAHAPGLPGPISAISRDLLMANITNLARFVGMKAEGYIK